MKFTILLLIFNTLLFFSTSDAIFIENFQDSHVNLSSWLEHSDTLMKEGKSKANLVLQKTVSFHRAILFTLLNPQSCGAAFAGVKKNTTMDLSKYSVIVMKIRGQGQYNSYEFILRHKGNEIPTYCHFFEAPSAFGEISLMLDDFKPYLTGKLLEDGVPLDKSQITSIGILAYGGAHSKKKQAGVASLEIDWIKIQ